MKDFGEYLYKDVEVTCKSGQVFKGNIMSFGGTVQAQEEYGIEDEYLSVNTGDSCYVLFKSEIKEIKVK